MNDIYVKFADIYEAMYKTFINYEEEYRDYSRLLNVNGGDRIIELACGTGNMFPYFEKDDIKYTGIDINQTMLDIASSKYPEAQWKNGDMREVNTENSVHGIFSMARSISYMMSNDDLINTCTAAYQQLINGGSFVFDFIDASRFILENKGGKTVTHVAKDGNKLYERVTYWEIDGAQSWSFRWIADYYEIINDERHQIYQDDSIVRAFTLDDIVLALRWAGFTDIQWEDRVTYAFPTYIVSAKK